MLLSKDSIFSEWYSLEFVLQMYIIWLYLYLYVLHMATITARVDDSVKLELRKFSDDIGISVGSLFNAWAKDLLRTKQVTFKVSADLLEDQEMYANASKLIQQGKKSVASWRSSLVL